MHVVQLLPELNQGGVERGTVELNRELVKRGHQSSVISLGGKQVNSIVQDGGNHYTLDVCSKNPLNFFARASKLRKLLQTIEPDILHARSRVPAWLTWHANKKLHLPFITTVHGFNSVNPYSAIMTKGDQVICVSKVVKEHVVTNYKTPADRYQIIYRGLDEEEFNENAIDHQWIKTFRSKHKLNQQYVISSIGRITQLKDYETYIHAIYKLKNDIPNVKALIVGGVHPEKKKYFHRLTSLVNKYQLTDTIIFTGSQNHMREIYTLSDLVISTSKKPESFGRTLIESMAMNTPAIATNHGGAVEILPKERLFEPQNTDQLLACIKNVYQHSPCTLRLKTLEQFSLDRMVDQILALYVREKEKQYV